MKSKVFLGGVILMSSLAWAMDPSQPEPKKILTNEFWQCPDYLNSFCENENRKLPLTRRLFRRSDSLVSCSVLKYEVEKFMEDMLAKLAQLGGRVDANIKKDLLDFINNRIDASVSDAEYDILDPDQLLKRRSHSKEIRSRFKAYFEFQYATLIEELYRQLGPSRRELENKIKYSRRVAVILLTQIELLQNIPLSYESLDDNELNMCLKKRFHEYCLKNRDISKILDLESALEILFVLDRETKLKLIKNPSFPVMELLFGPQALDLQ